MTSEIPGRATLLKIWDAPTRVFHWALVILIAASWWTAEERMRDWHRLSGYTIAALVLFRLVWGVVGSETSRFSAFVRGPAAIMEYSRGRSANSGQPSARPGHNPLGGWSVIAMLTLILAQLMLGTLAVDVDGLESGPFAYLVDFDTGRKAAELHELLFNILLGVIALHIVAVAFYLLFRRENLIGAMVSGSRRWAGDLPTLAFASTWRALTILVACGFLVWFVIANWGQA